MCGVDNCTAKLYFAARARRVQSKNLLVVSLARNYKFGVQSVSFDPMKLLIAFLRLVRSINLFFIVVTQVLFYYCVLPFSFRSVDYTPKLFLQPQLFWLLCASSLFIAAAGYIINDYFDLNIDQVNKPDKLVVDTIIKRRWAILWHWGMSFIGVIISFYVSWKLNNWIIGLANAGCVFLLMLYSSGCLSTNFQVKSAAAIPIGMLILKINAQ